MVVTSEILVAKFGTIFPHLDERQRRLLMGAEARALGHGGIRLVARAAGIREATVSLGADELTRAPGRARRPVADASGLPSWIRAPAASSAAARNGSSSASAAPSAPASAFYVAAPRTSASSTRDLACANHCVLAEPRLLPADVRAASARTTRCSAGPKDRATPGKRGRHTTPRGHPR